MKNIIFPLAITFVIVSQVKAQTPYYDAVKLKKLTVKIESNPITHDSIYKFKTDTTSMANIYKILKHYTYDPDTKKPDTTNQGIWKAFEGTENINPFIKPYLPALPATTSKISGGIANIASSLGGANVTAFADGLAKFLIKRGKEELLIAVINKLKDDKKFPEFQILFPHTRKLLDNFDSWEYSNVINTVREAFNKDLQQILGDIPQLTTLKPTDYEGKVKQRVQAIKTFIDSDAGRLLISAMQISNGFISGQKVPDIIHIVAGNGYLGDIPNAPSDITNAIKLFDIISYSIKSDMPGQDYLSANELATLSADPDLFNIYLGLVYQQLANKNIVINGVDLAKNLRNSHVYVITFTTNIKTFINAIISKAIPFKSAIDKLVDARKKEEKNLTPYINDVFQAADQFVTSATDINTIDANLTFPPNLQNAVHFAANTVEIMNDISVKNYSATVMSTLDLLSDNIKNPDISAFREFFVKYGSFAANIVQAKNSEDAEAAIEAIALPAGSYSIKQKSEWNIALNGYVGYGADLKYAQGVYAPVGLAISHSLGIGKGKGAISLFASAIDVGSVVTYRLNNGDKDELKQEVRLESIISPSVQAFIALPGLPITLGLGRRRTPKLFYSNGLLDVAEKSRWVTNFSILIDIPIFTLFNKSYK